MFFSSIQGEFFGLYHIPTKSWNGPWEDSSNHIMARTIICFWSQKLPWFSHLLLSIYAFSTIMASITECLKAKVFKWSSAVAQTFKDIKQKMIKAPILKLPNFS